MASWDVIVVGGGPAGATAAHRLSRSGLRVAVVEKDAPPRYKTCGGGVVGRARRLLPAGTDAVFETECREVTMEVGEIGRTFTVRREEPIVSMAMRARLDHALLRAATAAGATLISPHRARSVEEDGEYVTVGTEAGPLRSRFVVAADGAAGTTARLAGFAGPLPAAPALEWELPASAALMRRFASVARFDFDAGLEGYAWVFPKREQLSVGVLSVRRGRASLVRALERYLGRLEIPIGPAVARHGFLIPLAPRAQGFVRSRVIVVGDAAGLADPVTGEGITHALVSAAIAADCIVSCGFDARRVRQAYEDRLGSELLSELRIARRLAAVLYRPALRRELFARMGQRACEAMTDVVTGATTYRRLVGRPASYARLLLGRRARPGGPASAFPADPASRE